MPSAIETVEDAAGVGMTPDELEAIVKKEIEDAISYIDSEIGPRREKAQRYYRGEPFGNEEEGRSDFVSRELSDTVQTIMPSLMRVFFGAENNMQFASKRGDPQSVATARQATDYARHIIHNDNNGYLQFQSVFKDALYQKAGIVKWWWDDSVEVRTHEFTGLNMVTLADVAQEPGVELMAVTEGPDGIEAEVRRVRPHGIFRFEAVPPEEFGIDRFAKSIEDATLVYHSMLKTRGELVAMGYDEKLVDDHVTAGDRLTYNSERTTRFETVNIHDTSTEGRVPYTEAYIYVDYDGDGIDELRRVCTMGVEYEIVANDPWDHRPFADFCVDPVPHAFWGYDLFDKTEDIQRVQSDAKRLMLDSLGFSVYNRAGVVEGRVNINDVLNPEMGALIRMDAPGMYQPYDHKFNGANAFPVIEHFERVREARTGSTKASAGLEAEHLQSTTRAAVNATVQGAQQQLELIARNFAERGMKPFYKGLLRTIVKHQTPGRVVRLRGEYTEIDPKAWDATMDVQVNVVIGAGLIEERVAALREVAQYQANALQQMGPNNPLVTLGHLSKTLNRMTELVGFKERFFNELPDDFQPPPQPPKPDPAELLAQAQIADIQSRAQMDYLKLLADMGEAELRAMVELTKIDAKEGVDTAKLMLEAKKAVDATE